MKNIGREIVITILLALVIFMAIRTVAYNFEVSGQSMEPNLHNGQFIMISKIAYWFDDPDRGDIVVYYSDRVRNHVIHRIVGLPEETAEIKLGDLYINGKAMEESYIKDGTRSIPVQKIPEDHYFIVGDNRDAASWEVIPEDKIVGKAWVTYWPISEWGYAPNY